MDWATVMSEAINYIENNITEEISVELISKHICVSGFYFQRSFSMLCGYSVAEYVRYRRLALAAAELISTDIKVIDLALKYGYDSPDSFTKAFTRFHKSTPLAVRGGGKTVKSFAPLKIKLTLEGGYIMDYKIMKKEAFTVTGVSRMFGYENAKAEIPKFWAEHFASCGQEKVCGMFGICIDAVCGGKEFEYIIADNYIPWKEVPQGCKAVTIPSQTWAVFPIKGALPNALQNINTKIFSEWLPNLTEYEMAGAPGTAGYNIELYSNAADFKNGIHDENYYSEIWVPVKKK